MELRNCILIALAFDATPQEVDAAHDAIDRQFGGASVDPAIIVTAQVPTTPAQATALANATPIAAASNVTVDKNGLPWDERIHSSNKKLAASGAWWGKRGVTDAYVSQIEAELRATMGAAPAAAVTTTAPPALPGAGLPALPGAPAGLPPIPGAALPDPAYTAVVELIATNTQSVANPAGRITDEWLKQVLTHFGVAEGNLQNLAHNPALIPQIDAYIRQVLGA